jgi:hypothetical protein
MRLPFTHDQFLDVFAAYHRVFWPAAVLLWLLTLGALFHLWRAGPRASRLVATVLTIHWAWSAVGYHLTFFRRVNPSATVFAALFLVQSVLFLWRGVVHRRLTFAPSRSTWGIAASALVAYALVYPGLGFLSALSYPRMPTFGVPCPTTILTAGLLLLLPRQEARLLAVIPVIWAAIGGSAAFLLGVRADLVLGLAGGLLLLYILGPRGTGGLTIRIVAGRSQTRNNG